MPVSKSSSHPNFQYSTYCKQAQQNSQQSKGRLTNPAGSFWPILPVHQGILNHPSCSPKEFFPISPSHKRVLADPARSWGNSDHSCLLTEEFLPIFQCSLEELDQSYLRKGILTNPTLSRKSSGWSYLLTEEFLPIHQCSLGDLWPIPPSLKGIPSNQIHFQKDFCLILPLHKGILTNPVHCPK